MMFIIYVVSYLHVASQVLVSSLKKETEFITPNVKITVESTPKHRPRLQRKGNLFITWHYTLSHDIKHFHNDYYIIQLNRCHHMPHQSPPQNVRYLLQWQVSKRVYLLLLSHLVNGELINRIINKFVVDTFHFFIYLFSLEVFSSHQRWNLTIILLTLLWKW